MTIATAVTVQKGGAWLLEDTPLGGVFTPERMTEEQRLVDRTAQEFVVNEVVDSIDQLETKDWDLARQLLRRCGELGLLGTDVPEEFGGIPMDKVTSAVIASRLGHSGSFSTAFGAQTGLAILPIRAFGTENQKTKYLPKLVSGEWVGAYCLSESGSGSDALGAKARAVRQEDGGFVLNGEKMWITNGGFADVYIVFAKVDGEHFTAFIVERNFDGVSSGAEEHKMGLLGSSTTPVILQDAKVPAENLLGEIGKGHKVAFNVLNYGRFKLGASTVGGTRGAIGEAARYAAQRQQFGEPIASFGAIKHKLGEMTVRAYAIESMVFRTAGLIDASLEGREATDDGALLAALEEYAIESSIVKVAGSEALHYVLDENVQIHGGNGFVKDYPAERHYRDSRVNRIFEGTNEINRLLIPGMLVKRALKGGLPLVEAAKRLQDEIMTPAPSKPDGDGPLARQQSAVTMFKKVGLAVLGLALQTYRAKLSEQQEVLSFTADILIDTFATESAVQRALQATDGGERSAALQADAARALANDAAMRIEGAARSALAAMAEGDTLRTHLAALRRLLKVTPVNVVAIRRRLADETVERAGYIF
jgi:alkylation response protein AidB-like acyl-CoA dehydrogenase